MTASQTFVLRTGYDRREASRACLVANEGQVVEIRAPRRSLPQNDRLHAMLGDIVKSEYEVEGIGVPSIDDWKTLFVSVWMIETGKRSCIVKGLNGEAVQLYWRTSMMSKEQIGELMIIVERFCAERGIELKETA